MYDHARLPLECRYRCRPIPLIDAITVTGTVDRPLCNIYSAHPRSSDQSSAYHGHTDTVIDISPYKYGKRNGAGKKPWIHQVRCPDVYRGEHGTRSATAISAAAKAARAAAAAGADEEKKEGGDWVTEAEAAERYAAHVGEACSAAEDRKASGEGKGVAAFFIESGMSVAGVILPPDGYLKACYERVRAVNGICVADEVQVRYGLVGGGRGGGFSVKRTAAMRWRYGGFHGWRIQSCARVYSWHRTARHIFTNR